MQHQKLINCIRPLANIIQHGVRKRRVNQPKMCPCLDRPVQGQPLVTCTYRALEMRWLQTEMCPKCDTHTGLQRLSVKKNKKVSYLTNNSSIGYVLK
jgi:hypothetical protein